jgi:trimethylamine--corrinoid protein Co-methyltransferase
MLKLTPLTSEVVEQIIAESMNLLAQVGVRVHHRAGLRLLANAGADVDFDHAIARIPESLIWQALGTVPFGFSLYNLDGRPAVECGGERVQFAPGSLAINVLENEAGEQRPADANDLVYCIKLVEALEQFDAHSVAFVCTDAPEKLSNIYGLYVALNFMNKPILMGSLAREHWPMARDMLVTIAGGSNELMSRPVAMCEIHCSPPLLWTEAACQSLIDCARAGVPVQIVSTPLAGMSSPITLAASVVQYAAETLSGLTIVQLARAGTPAVFGCAAAITDMRNCANPASDIAAWMIDSACLQVGKALGVATQAHMGNSDGKTVDFQAGLEVAGGIYLAALSGANLITGAGMVDYLRCLSFEKLVLDAEVMGMARRLVAGIEIRNEPIALDLMRNVHISELDHLYSVHTSQWYRREIHPPSSVIERGTLDSWQRGGAKNAFQRAAEQADLLVHAYRPSPLSDALRDDLRRIMNTGAGKRAAKRLTKIVG